LKQVVILGGGIAGLIAANVLVRKGFVCTVIEKRNYPLQRVCGEYISNEATPFLRSMDLYPSEFDPPEINRFLLSSSTGKSETLPLDMGGFGISRFEFDHFLFKKAQKQGVEFMLDTEVLGVDFSNQQFHIKTTGRTLEAAVVLGAYGKRSRLDAHLHRNFVTRRSPFVGVKYHVKADDYPPDLISLHNFPGGYCGICSVENNKVNVCYLSHRDNFKKHKSIDELEQHVLFSNPKLKQFLLHANHLWERPEVINEITFASKTAVENHILMIGDSAGMIAPLCGNGMAIAIHSAKLACDAVSDFLANSIGRTEMEERYESMWRQHFSRRLFVGRAVQKLFGSQFASSLALGLTLYSKPLARLIIRNTHGNTF
jgi:menaquinone-9 beta-reductase